MPACPERRAGWIRSRGKLGSSIAGWGPCGRGGAMAHSIKVQQCVEALCQNGCGVVRATIRALEQGLTVAQTDAMAEHERAAVLQELKAIMAVYDARDQTNRDQS